MHKDRLRCGGCSAYTESLCWRLAMDLRRIRLSRSASEDLRLPDVPAELASAESPNPYLALAAALMGATWGMARNEVVASQNPCAR